MKAEEGEAFLRENGCDATADELGEFIELKMAADTPMEVGTDDLQEMIGGSILTDTVGCTKRDSCGCSNTCNEACC